MQRLASYLNEPDRAGSILLQKFGGLLTPKTLAAKLQDIINWGESQRVPAPSGAGTTDDDEVEWDERTYARNDTAEAMRQMYTCYYR